MYFYVEVWMLYLSASLFITIEEDLVALLTELIFI